MAWIILRVVPQFERLTASTIRRGLDLATYVPVEVFRIANRGRTLERHRPLMSGYVFARVTDPMPWREISAIRRVRDWLSIGDRPALLSDAEIVRIRDLEQAHNAARNAIPRGLHVGDRIRITKGPFASVETLIAAVRGSEVDVEVPFLGGPRPVSIPAEAVKLV